MFKLHKLQEFIDGLDENEKIYLSSALLMVRYRHLMREDAIEVVDKYKNERLDIFIKNELKMILQKGPKRDYLKIY